MEFKITKKELEPGLQQVEFTADKAELVKERSVLLREVSGMVQVPGFRKGKAPMGMVLKKYSDHIQGEMDRRVMEAAYKQVADDEDFKFVSVNAPDGKEVKIDCDQDLVIRLNFDMEPVFELPEYKGLKIDVAAPEIEDEKIEAELAQMKEMYATYENIAEASVAGDMLKVSYTSDCELPEGTSPTITRLVNSEENWIWLQDPEMMPGVVAALTGKTKNEEFEFTSEFPNDYREAELAGKTVKYNGKVIEVQRRKLLEDEAELVKRSGLEDMDALKKSIVDRLSQQGMQELREKQADAVMEKLEEATGELILPPTMLKSETDRQVETLRGDKKDDEIDFPAICKEAKVKAINELTRSFILSKIAKKEDIKVTESEMDMQMNMMSRYYGMKGKELKAAMSKSGRINELAHSMMQSKTRQFLVDQADTGEEKA
jgi:trigger factor